MRRNNKPHTPFLRIQAKHKQNRAFPLPPPGVFFFVFLFYLNLHARALPLELPARPIAQQQRKQNANFEQVAEGTKVEFEEPQAFAAAVRAVRSDISFADWCLVGYKNENVLRVVGSGKGGLEALLDAAEPYGVNYGLLRVGPLRCMF